MSSCFFTLRDNPSYCDSRAKRAESAWNDSGELTAGRAETALRELWDATQGEEQADLRARSLEMLREETERASRESPSQGHTWLMTYLRFESDPHRAEELLRQLTVQR
jgi:hypothetical protein